MSEATTDAMPPTDETDPHAGLPPAPWRARYTVPDGGSPEDEYYPAVDSLVDANDIEILGMMHEDGGQIIVSPSVLRAILALPALVAAARAMVATIDGLPRFPGNAVIRARNAVEEVLVLAGIPVPLTTPEEE
jgi:hypothetical protein